MSETHNAAARDRHRVPEVRTRTDSVVSWIGWHIGELAGVIVPGVIALTVTPWAAVVSVVVGAGWVAHGMRLTRQQSSTALALVACRSEEDTPDPDTAVGWGDAR